MAFNKKIFCLFLLFCLIVPQAIYAEDTSDLTDIDSNNTSDIYDLDLSSTDQNSISDYSIILNDSTSSGHDGKDTDNLDESLSDYSNDGYDLSLKDNAYLVSENDDLNLDLSLEEKTIDAMENSNESDLFVKADLKAPLSDKSTFNVFIISDNTGNNLFDAVACEILDNSSFSNVKFSIRSGNQINEMEEEELYALMSDCDAFIGQWVSSNVDAVLTNLLDKHPNLSDKELFLILEPPTGNINSSSTSLNLVRNSTISHKKIFTGLSNDDLIYYFKATKRGNDFNAIQSYITDNSSSFNSIFNNLVLYKDINDKSNLKNELLYILNLLGHGCYYEAPNFTGVQASGIFRDRW